MPCIVASHYSASLTNETSGNAKAGRFSCTVMRKRVSGGVVHKGREGKEVVNDLRTGKVVGGSGEENEEELIICKRRKKGGG